ncbi:hypothetical protein NDU88_005768 [Pleurodeles waltl]|uniref:Uncharacterized protein n=1 Tax=Pleurodeles waltl TaxID=8319 RepID=A0AAV7QGY0_PLEWA|nr:hypothetical protein NDU88_005768 [Pleurodeles waltl]
MTYGENHFLNLLVLPCAITLFVVKTTDALGAFPLANESATTRAPERHLAVINGTITPNELLESPAPTWMPTASTLDYNSSTNRNNRSEVSSAASVSGLAGTTIHPFTVTSAVTSDNSSVNSSGLASGKTTDTLPSTTGTAHETFAFTNTSEITEIPTTHVYYTKPINTSEGTEVNSTGAYTTALTVERAHLKNSEAILTIAFSIILGIVVLVILVYSLNKCKTRRSQYSHHPLHASSYESVDHYMAPEDTLVISGGLYDAPRVYNPTMTVFEDEESQHDYVSFASRPGQFRLEFLPGERETEPGANSRGLGTFHSPHRSL